MGLKFHRQAVIRGYVADFYCAELGLVLEMEHKTPTSQQDHLAFKKLMFSYMGLTEVILRKGDISRERLVAKFAALKDRSEE